MCFGKHHDVRFDLLQFPARVFPEVCWHFAGNVTTKTVEIKLTQPVQSNGVFATIPKEYIPALQEKYFFYVWDDAISEVRLMASFDTSEDDIRDFVAFVRETVK